MTLLSPISIKTRLSVLCMYIHVYVYVVYNVQPGIEYKDVHICIQYMLYTAGSFLLLSYMA